MPVFLHTTVIVTAVKDMVIIFSTLLKLSGLPLPNRDEVEDVEGHSTCELGVASMTTDGGS